jgi:dihydrofolate reductase
MESIYAIDSKNGLSKNGDIPWKSKTDMLFFMNKTINNIVIMGKNTFFTIPKEHRPLKNRLNIVLTSTPNLYIEKNVIFTNKNDIYQDTNYEGIVSKSNFNSNFTDLNPSFNFEAFRKLLENEQFA